MRLVGRGAQGAVRAVRVADHGHGFADGANDREDILGFVLQRVIERGIGRAAATPRDRVDAGVPPQLWCDPCPVALVIAERAVDEHERWTAAVDGVRHP